MMRIGTLAMAAALVSSAAMADYRPGFERPIEGADLVAGQRTYPAPTRLVLNTQDGAAFATSFTLTEDTGIRCITTPCPSSQTGVYAVVGHRTLLGGAIEYTAVGHVVVRPRRVVQRTVVLVDYRPSALRIRRPYLWDVTVKEGLRTVGRAVGNPEPIYTTASGIDGVAADEGAEDGDAVQAE